MAQTLRQHGAQQVVQQRFVAGFGVAAAGELGQRQRALGQGLEDQHRGPAAVHQGLHHGRGGVGAVAGKTGRAAYQQGGVIRHGLSFALSLACTVGGPGYSVK